MNETDDQKFARLKQEDLNRRAQLFNEEMIPLLKKHNLGLGAVAFLLPDGRIAARPQLFDPADIPKPLEAEKKVEPDKEAAKKGKDKKSNDKDIDTPQA